MTGAAQSARLEDPTESAPAAQEAADEIVDRFVAHLRLSVGQQLRLAQVRERLIGLGVHPASPAYARYLSPMICATPEEQAQLLTGFAELEARLRREGLAPPIPAVSDTASPLVTPPVARPKTPWWRSVPGLTALGALTLTVMGVALLLILYVPPQTGTPPTTLPEFIRELTNQPIPPTRQTHEAPNGWWFHSKLTPWAVIGLIPLLATLLAAVVIFARRFQAFRPQPDQARKAVLPIVLDGHFADLASSRAVLDLGRYIVGMGRRLHVRRTLRATLRNGGFPTPRFGGRAHAPDYVALVERQSPRDHLPLISDVLGRRFHSQFVALSRFAFRREPSLLRSLDDPGAGDIHLEELTSAMPEARWLIIAEAEPLFLQPGRLAPWLQRLIDTGKVAFFNPRGRGDWEEDEHFLRRAGVAVLSATSGGLRNYADWLLSDGAAEGTPAQTEAAGVDLPFHLARHQAQLLDESLSDVAFEGLMNDLKAWLGESGMRLFRALAIYPRLEPSLTLALGRALSREPEPEPRAKARPETGAAHLTAFPAAARRIARVVFNQAFGVSLRNERARAERSIREARFAGTRPTLFTRLVRLFGLSLAFTTRPPAGPAPHRPLLDDDLLVRLVRLPWLRLGYMPSSFRRRLARRITASDLPTTVRVVEAFLLADAEAVLDPSARPPADRDLLIRWLKTHRDTDLHDTILIDALSGRRPDEPKPPKGALARARGLIPGLSDPPLLFAMALGLMLMWLQPQTVTRMDAPRPPHSEPNAALQPNHGPSPGVRPKPFQPTVPGSAAVAARPVDGAVSADRPTRSSAAANSSLEVARQLVLTEAEHALDTSLDQFLRSRAPTSADQKLALQTVLDALAANRKTARSVKMLALKATTKSDLSILSRRLGVASAQAEAMAEQYLSAYQLNPPDKGLGLPDDEQSASAERRGDTSPSLSGPMNQQPFDPKIAKLESKIAKASAVMGKTVPITATVSVESASVRLDNVASWDPETCRVFAPPVTNVLGPAHGRVQTRPGTLTMQAEKCGSISGPSTEVLYAPASDMSANDLVAYDVPMLRQTTVVRITLIRAPPSGAAAQE